MRLGVRVLGVVAAGLVLTAAVAMYWPVDRMAARHAPETPSWVYAVGATGAYVCGTFLAYVNAVNRLSLRWRPWAISALGGVLMWLAMYDRVDSRGQIDALTLAGIRAIVVTPLVVAWAAVSVLRGGLEV
jgi:hypothetical protein